MQTRSMIPRALSALTVAAFCATAGNAAGASPFVEPDVDVLYTLPTDQPGSQFGFVGESIGDLDGDGVTEFVIGQPQSHAAASFAGQAKIYSGVTGTLLHVVQGGLYEFLGTSVAALGDVNDDGTPDYAVSAPGIPAFIGFPWPARVVVFSGADHSIIHQTSGPVGSNFGQDINSAGDVNGDGRQDLVVGAPFDDTGSADAGSVTVLDGATGTLLWTSNGDFAGDKLGGGVSGVDDLDGDGVPDQLAGAQDAGPSQGGLALVLSGATGHKIDTLAPLPTAGQFGQFFAHDAGDVNGDGTGDLYVGDFADSALGPVTGRAYVYSGADRSPLWTFDGSEADAGFGIGRGAADVNGDGHADLFLAAYKHDDGAPNAGKAYLYSGRDGGVIRTFTGNVAGDLLGFDAVPLDDVNGDGIGDYLITGSDIAHVVAGTDASASGRIASLCALIGAIPDDAFAGPAAQRRDALCSKLDALAAAFEAGAYNGAADKLRDDLRAKADGSLGGDPADDWIVDPDWQSFLAPWFEGLLRLAASS